jgi:ribosomal protein L29
MSTVSELVQANFKLTAELKLTRGELATLRAEKQMADSEEVERIKQAYAELESEVVKLRQELLEHEKSRPLSFDEACFSHSIGSVETQGVIAMLSDQLSLERQRSQELQDRIVEIKRDSLSSSVLYSDESTCVGSPFYRTSADFEISKLEAVMINPPLEELFKAPISAPRKLALLSEPMKPVADCVKRATLPAGRPTDGAVKRLAKIARFKP